MFWVPFFYLFRRSASGGQISGGVWALLFGSITAILHFLLGTLVEPGGFGLSRWVYGFVEIISLPALVPLLIYTILSLFRGFDDASGFADFSLLWLIPVAALRSISWGSQNDPILLVMAPLLWTALAVGIPFFIKILFLRVRWYVIIPVVLCILILPVAAASAYWFFFSHDNIKGAILLSVVIIPMILSVLLDFIKGSE